ncbi:Uncharacterised protein [Klebsiella pneumoniae]|nr:Uncharacterised protein [Klebsiella pneumoniae]
MQDTIDIMKVLFPVRLIQPQGRHQLGVAFRGNSPLTRHDSDRVSRNQMNKYKRQ